MTQLSFLIRIITMTFVSQCVDLTIDVRGTDSINDGAQLILLVWVVAMRILHIVISGPGTVFVAVLFMRSTVSEESVQRVNILLYLGKSANPDRFFRRHVTLVTWLYGLRAADP